MLRCSLQTGDYTQNPPVGGKGLGVLSGRQGQATHGCELLVDGVGGRCRDSRYMR
jgi:hypothetical protein